MMTAATLPSKATDAEQVLAVCETLDELVVALGQTDRGKALAMSVRAEVRAVRLALASGTSLRRLKRRCFRFAKRFNRQADRLGLLTEV